MLTVNQIKGLKPKDSSHYVWENSRERGKGRFGVKVQPSGSISYTFRYYAGSKAKFINIGKFPGMSLANARKISIQYSDLLSNGIDPKEFLEQEAKAKERAEADALKGGSFQQLIEMHTEYKKDKGNRSYADEKQKIVDNVYPYVDIHKKAKDFEPEDFIKALSIPIEQGFEPKSNKIRSILHAAFNFALNNDHNPKYLNHDVRFGIKHNPISAIPKQTEAEKSGTHYMSWQEVAQLMIDMENRFHDLDFAYQTRQVLRLCFYLGGQRPHEVVTIRWSEVNFEQRYVLVREEYQKVKKPHVVPLVDSAIKILQDLQAHNHDDSPFVFYKKTNHLEHMPTNTIAQALLTYKKRTDIRQFVARDFRRTVKTLGGEAGISKEFRDRIHGHAISDVSGKHYDMYEYISEKRQGLEIWEEALNQKIECLKKLEY
ncbi:tyrosine-type recombinase/integrase [Vibrio vulnificus]|uniref:tyrosine-type recombinase/integrase n=1 Tax=Vibrio vulnificus TaxID=672 RepID=UPI000722DD56|nr:site-specific integrase [Vibrio vulnificus]ALM70322.1 Integrase [Vibrio vulnificus]ANH63870.1 Integrase [Vibrio vulnificus]EGR0086751.1 tyrosine-type recombinase/integrase [Vibrio vulnificus]EGR0095941.1 tyrosine-type recombinase/integrase [Vibrio vulnificus]EGR0106853.1 tyrosine-type recombinase/integrase [Vibrio vulnificus]